MENKLRCFQYKVIHNILPTNYKLYKMKLKTSPSCDRCGNPYENLLHLLYEYNEFLPKLKLYKDRLKLYEHDKIWNKICEHLGGESSGWKFIKS